MHFVHERMGLWPSLTSPLWLNTEFPSRAGDELEDLPPVLLLVKIENLGCLPPFNPRNTEGLGVSSFILLKTEGCCSGVDGYNLLKTDDFEFDATLSPFSFSSSSAMM